MPLTLLEWEIAVAAYAYEVLDEPIMSDFTYDLFCRLRGCSGIPGYDKDTGQWVHGLDLTQLSSVHSKAHSYYPKHKDIHLHQIHLALIELNIAFEGPTYDSE